MSKYPKNWWKLIKIANIDRNSSNLLNDIRNFNEIFKEDVTYDNIKSHKNHGFTLSLEDAFLENPEGVTLQLSKG